MRCPKCAVENGFEASRCEACGQSLAVAVVEVLRGEVSDAIRFLRPRPYTIGRARGNDIVFNERSISKVHARLDYRDGRFFVEDAGSRHGVYVNASKVTRAELPPGAQIQLGNLTLKYSLLGSESVTGAMGKLPWVEQQQLLLSLVQTLNASLVLSQVLDQVLGAIVSITGAERGNVWVDDRANQNGIYPETAESSGRVSFLDWYWSWLETSLADVP